MGFPAAPAEMDNLTWRQVVKNMKNLMELANTIGNITSVLGDEYTDLADMITSMINLITDLNDRIGTISVLVDNMAVNTPPDSYKYDITYEFKDPEVLGLSDKPGFEGLTHTLVQTVVHPSIEGDTNFTPYQIAMGNDMKQYYRTAETGPNGELIWGEWQEIRYGTQILFKDVQPDDDEQAPGDIWALKVN